MNFLKTTVIGGFLFLVPIIILIVILGKAHAIMARLAAPLARWIPLEEIGGVALANLLGVAAMVALCFAAGLVAKSRAAATAMESLESRLLLSIPGYVFVKGMIGDLADSGAGTGLVPVLVRFDDSRQIAFEVERGGDGLVVVFVPGAPEPWSGAVLVVTEDRVERIDAGVRTVVKNLRTLGRGTVSLLSPKGVESAG